jgi:Na+(H+)/acetate symporter ActP
MPIVIFLCFVGFVLGLSFWLGRKTKSASGYFAAGGQIHWFVNGIAFAGDYLSAASFLGICGMIAFLGYDGFLYSIGYLAGWIVALFVVAEPMKRLGKYTFADALDAKFNSKGIQLAAGISTLIVSVCYLIPQMVGAGVLVEPLLGIPHHWGVIMVGAIVIYIVATAGMTSTTYVQFLKGGMLIFFSLILTIFICAKGFTDRPEMAMEKGEKLPFYKYETLSGQIENDVFIAAGSEEKIQTVGVRIIKDEKTKKEKARFYKLSHPVPLETDKDGRFFYVVKGLSLHLSEKGSIAAGQLLSGEKKNAEKIIIAGRDHAYEIIGGKKVLVLRESNMADADGIILIEKDGKVFAQIEDWWKAAIKDNGVIALQETQSKIVKNDAAIIINGSPKSNENFLRYVGNASSIEGKSGKECETGSVSPFGFLSKLSSKTTIINRWTETSFKDGKDSVTVFYSVPTPGSEFMRPGLYFKVEGTLIQKLNFISLMLALFFGTAALPHILIRYYTVPSAACARKSTIVAIASIGAFYVLTLFLGLGAAVNGALNPETSNMSAPLLARVFGEWFFAIISAIAFATVLGTVSGLIVAASGAVAHDLLDRRMSLNMSDKTKVLVGKLTAFIVGVIAIILGITFKGMNVSFLVGWAFAVAASANLPAIMTLLFWKKTTAEGIVASITVGIISSLGIILLSPDMFPKYGLSPESAPIPFGQPGIISIPLSFITIIIVSLMTQKKDIP